MIRFLEYLHVLSFGHFFFRARYPKVLVPHIDPIQPTIVTLHNLVRHNLQNTTEKRIHCRKMSAGERLFRDRKKCTYFMTSLVVLTNAASKCDARNELYSYKISQFMNFIFGSCFRLSTQKCRKLCSEIFYVEKQRKKA